LHRLLLLLLLLEELGLLLLRLSLETRELCLLLLGHRWSLESRRLWWQLAWMLIAGELRL
jgi:hypothetical protein